MGDVLIPETTLRGLDEFARLHPDERQQSSPTSSDWPSLQPLVTDSDACAGPFPFEALGPILGEAARAIAKDVQAPDALAGGSVLAAASLATSPLANVMLPHGARSPLSLFVITSVASGDRKSATDAVACHAIDEKRKRQSREHAKELQRWERENADRKKSDQARPPIAQVLTISNATIEGISKLLKSQSSVGVFASEGGEMLGGHSLRDDKRMAGLSFYLKAWGAEALDSLRSGDGLTVLLGRRIALHVLVQPVLLGQLLSDPMAQGQGLLARCLISQPETLAGSRLFRRVDPMKNPSTQRFNACIAELLERVPNTWEEGDGYELRPNDLHMADEASAAWEQFYNQVEMAQSHGGDLSAARPFASKAAEQAARIAGVIAFVEGASKVEYSHMQGGIELATYYVNEHLRLTGASLEDRQTKQLKTLLDWMRSQGNFVPHSAILQRSPRPIRGLKAEGIGDLLDGLRHRGYLRESSPGLWEVRDV